MPKGVPGTAEKPRRHYNITTGVEFYAKFKAGIEQLADRVMPGTPVSHLFRAIVMKYYENPERVIRLVKEIVYG